MTLRPTLPELNPFAAAELIAEQGLAERRECKAVGISGRFPHQIPTLLQQCAIRSQEGGAAHVQRRDQPECLVEIDVAENLLDLGIAELEPEAIAFLKSRDLALNACPSMHVAFAVFSAPWLARALREMHAARWLHVLNVAWCLAIVWSTIATRQHVFIDVVCGALLGGAIAALHLRAVPSQPGSSR